MFNALFEEIEKWMRQLLSGMVTSNLTNMFTDVNQKTGEIASQVGQTPQGWNGSIFSMIRSLSNSVIIPIAGMIITFILCYELISMVTSANNMHDVDTFMFFKYFFKMWVAVWIVSHTFDMVMAIFDVGQHVVNSAAGVIGGSTAIDISSLVGQMSTTMQTMEMGELVLLALETLLVSFGMKVMSVIITVVLYGRMIEIYLYSSVAAIPFATMSNREWGQSGDRSETTTCADCWRWRSRASSSWCAWRSTPCWFPRCRSLTTCTRRCSASRRIPSCCASRC